MRQRIRLAQAIAHDPAVLVLDEPLNGLDPLVRAETIALFRDYAARGHHVILSSHVLQEVDVFSDQVILIANGRIVAEGAIRSVREEIHEHPSQFLLQCRQPARLAALLFEQADILEARIDPARIALSGVVIDGVLPMDENVDALYEYLIGGGQ
jgi:ABC-2 type transport system ATP-binding protein